MNNIRIFIYILHYHHLFSNRNDPNIILKGNTHFWTALFQYSSNPTNKMDDSNNNINIPDEFICPLTHEIMEHPLVTRQGFTFEREAIIQWIDETRSCPLTRKPLSISNLIHDRHLKARIEQWKEENGYKMDKDAENENAHYDEIMCSLREALEALKFSITEDLVEEREIIYAGAVIRQQPGSPVPSSSAGKRGSRWRQSNSKAPSSYRGLEEKRRKWLSMFKKHRNRLSPDIY